MIKLKTIGLFTGIASGLVCIVTSVIQTVHNVRHTEQIAKWQGEGMAKHRCDREEKAKNEQSNNKSN